MLTFPNTPEANLPPGVPVLTARPVTPAVAEHGEGPVWHPSFDGVRWVDMQAGDILELAGTEDVRRTHVGTVAAASGPAATAGSCSRTSAGSSCSTRRCRSSGGSPRCGTTRASG